jgi:hypothetical protein
MQKQVLIKQRCRCIARWICACLILVVVWSAGAASAQENSKVLRCGWYHWDPYQYTVADNDMKRLTGLDIQLVRTVFESMG